MTIIKASRIRPATDHITVKPFEPIQHEGSLVLPDVAKDTIPHEGQVIDVGPSCDWVNPGDRVLFSKYAATTVVLDDGEVCVMRQGDVVGFPE